MQAEGGLKRKKSRERNPKTGQQTDAQTTGTKPKREAIKVNRASGVRWVKKKSPADKGTGDLTSPRRRPRRDGVPAPREGDRRKKEPGPPRRKGVGWGRCREKRTLGKTPDLKGTTTLAKTIGRNRTTVGRVWGGRTKNRLRNGKNTEKGS